MAGLAGNDGEYLFLIQVSQPLPEQLLMSTRFAHMGSQARRGKIGVDPVAFGLPAQFGRRDEQFFLGVALQGYIRRAAGDPLALHLRVGRAEVKRIIAHRDGGFDHLGIAKRIVPVVKMVHLDPVALLHNRRAFRGGGAGGFQKAVIVGDPAVLSLAPLLHSPQVSGLRGHADAAVLVLIVNLVGILSEVGVEIREHPEGMMPGVNHASKQARPLCRLGIAEERVDELLIGRLEEPFDHRSKVRFGPGTSLLGAAILRQQALKIDAMEFLPPSTTIDCGNRSKRCTQIRSTIITDR